MHSLYIFPTYEFMGYLNDVKPTVTYLSFIFDSSIIDSSIINDSLIDIFCRIIVGTGGIEPPLSVSLFALVNHVRVFPGRAYSPLYDMPTG